MQCQMIKYINYLYYYSLYDQQTHQWQQSTDFELSFDILRRWFSTFSNYNHIIKIKLSGFHQNFFYNSFLRRE